VAVGQQRLVLLRKGAATPCAPSLVPAELRPARGGAVAVRGESSPKSHWHKAWDRRPPRVAQVPGRVGRDATKYFKLVASIAHETRGTEPPAHRVAILGYAPILRHRLVDPSRTFASRPRLAGTEANGRLLPAQNRPMHRSPIARLAGACQPGSPPFDQRLGSTGV
jgi:hypothetical protein